LTPVSLLKDIKLCNNVFIFIDKYLHKFV
jgi:hypothetical protein